jgi:hypothetical protein
MATWKAFAAAMPHLAAEGRRMFYQYGVGLGFLATVRKDGGPRIHPICPIVTDDGLYTFIVPSPKLNDLRRDGRYALHTFPAEETDDEFVVMGRAVEIDEPEVRANVAAVYHAAVHDDHVLFALDVERCLHAIYRHRGDWPPTYTKWIDPDHSGAPK